MLSIKNKTALSHRFRLSPLPPYDYGHNFSYTLVKSPLPNDSLVAPGMSCVYCITFKPDSLANLTFILMVSTESGYSFSVPVCARREPPILTLPNTLHCGPCRAGFVARRKWEFQNSGGSGRFMILTDSDTRDPWTIIKNIDQERTITDNVFREGPFEISPAFFTLNQCEKATLHVTYIAEEVEATTGSNHLGMFERIDQITIKIGCDNGQILQLPLIALAQTSRLKITRAQTEDGHIMYHNQLPKTDKLDMIMDFGQQNPHAVSTYLISVKNKTQLRLPFRWLAYDNPGNLRLDKIPPDCVPSDSFQIIPSKGWLGPDAETTFEINFNPDTIRKYDVLTKLLLCNDAPRLGAEGSGVLEEEAALTLKCSGEGISYAVEVSPPILIVPQTIYTSNYYTTQLRLYNMSVSRIAFEWLIENVDEAALEIEMSQTSGAILPHSVLVIDIRMLGKYPQKVDGTLICSTAHSLGPKLRIPLKANVELRPGSIEFNTEMIDFGLLALGSSRKQKVSMVNKSPYAVAWKSKGHSRSRQGAKDKSFFLSCEPNNGFLDSGESQEMEVSFVPTWYQSFRGLLECQVIGVWKEMPENPGYHVPVGAAVTASAVQIKAEVQTPRLQILNPTNQVTCFLGVPFEWRVILQNLTMLTSKFKWMPFNSQNVDVQFFPQEGELVGKSSIEVRLVITCRSLGALPDISFYCHVDDMVEDGGLVRVQLDAFVRNVDVSFHILGNKVRPGSIPKVAKFTTRRVPAGESRLPHVSTGANQLVFNFGSDCPVFGTRMRSLVVRNMSSTTSRFKISFENYAATVFNHGTLEPQLDSSKESPGGTKEGYLLKPTTRTKLGFSSKSGQSYINNINKVRSMIQQMHDLLGDGKGAAFNPTPSEGMIGPWEEIKIDIVSYNNLV